MSWPLLGARSTAMAAPVAAAANTSRCQRGSNRRGPATQGRPAPRQPARRQNAEEVKRRVHQRQVGGIDGRERTTRHQEDQPRPAPPGEALGGHAGQPHQQRADERRYQGERPERDPRRAESAEAREIGGEHCPRAEPAEGHREGVSPARRAQSPPRRRRDQDQQTQRQDVPERVQGRGDPPLDGPGPHPHGDGRSVDAGDQHPAEEPEHGGTV
jgi:hypothetical protein